MTKTKILSILVPIFLIITLVFNGFAASGALNGIATGDISDKYPVLFTPADYVFSIWSLIYLSLAAFSIFQILPMQFKDSSLNSVRVWFIVTSVLNSLWILLWQYEYLIPSLGIMVLLLLSLIKIYTQEIGIKPAVAARKWFLQAPFSLYLGWISVATIANVSVVLYDLNWNGFGISPLAWTVIMMSVAALLAIIMILKRRDYIFAAVIIWALIGISAKNNGLDPVRYTTIIGVVLLLLVGTYQGLFNKKSS